MSQALKSAASWFDEFAGLVRAIMLALIVGMGSLTWANNLELVAVRGKIEHLAGLSARTDVLQSQQAAMDARLAVIDARLEEHSRRLDVGWAAVEALRKERRQ